MMTENRAELLSVQSWINWKVVCNFLWFTVHVNTPPTHPQQSFLDALFFFLAEKEQTPLQEALNQLIRQLQRCSTDWFIDMR